MTLAFFAPTAPEAPRYTFARRAIESFIVTVAAAAAFGGVYFGKFAIVMQVGVMASRGGPASPIMKFLQIAPYAAAMSLFFAVLLVIVYWLTWLGVGVVTFALASVPALQRRPHILRVLAYLIVGASAIAGLFAMPSGGPGGAFVG